MSIAETETEIKKLDCPNCKHGIDIEVKRPRSKVVLQESPSSELEAIKQSIAAIAASNAKNVKADSKPKVVAPSFIPRFLCPSGNCDIGNHMNPNFKVPVKKKCTNCDQFHPSSAKKCIWCEGTEFEDLDAEDLQVMNIPMPKAAEHEHEHEEGA